MCDHLVIPGEGDVMRNPLSIAPCLPKIVIVLAFALSAGCAHFDKSVDGERELVLGPITDNPSGKMYPGRIVWHDLLTSDLRVAGSFYQQVFGWQIEYQEHSALARNNGKRVAGILELPMQDDRSRAEWIPSVSVTDVDTTAISAQDHGGKVLKGPVDMDRRGRAALIRDFQGASLVLLTALGGDPTQADAEVGEWLWNEIWTDDPVKTENYYSAVLGYDGVVPVKDDYSVFMKNEKWIAGMRHLQEKREDLAWIPVVRVADPESVATQVELSGGEVVIPPDQAPVKGNTALISDPTGGLLLIQRWPPQTSDHTN